MAAALRRMAMVAMVAVMHCPSMTEAFVGVPNLAPRVAHSSLTAARAGISLPLAASPSKFVAAQFKRSAQASGVRQFTVGKNGAGRMEMNFITEGIMRVVSCLPYILPMMDSLAYGRFLFQKLPFLQAIFMVPLQPFVELAQAFPMLSFVSFLGLFLFVVRNKTMPRFIRFNTMQALLLEIIMIFPQILTSSNMGGLIPFMFTEFISNMTFYAVVSIVGYSCIANLKGELPCKIPVISTAVFQQIGGGAGYDE